MLNKFNPLLSDTFKTRFKAPSLNDIMSNIKNDGNDDYYNTKVAEFNEQIENVQYLCSAIDNSGVLPDGTIVSLKDVAMTSSQIQQFVEPTIETYIRESITPFTNISALFDEIDVPKPVEINMKAFGSFDVADIAEGSPVPMRIFDVAGSAERIALGFKKYGAGISLTKEAIESDNWGFLKYWLNEAGKAFARNREKKAMIALSMKSQILMDNNGASLLGPTRGRGISGAFNGTLTPADLAMTIAHGQVRDVNYDTILMNPMAWMMFRLYFGSLTSTKLPGNVGFYKPPKGGPAQGWPSSTNKFFKEAPGKYGNPSMTDPLGLLTGGYPNFAMLGATFQDDPFNVGSPINVIISPWVPYRQITDGSAKDKYVTDIYLIDSSNVGAFFNRYGPTITEWDDKSIDAVNWKVVESFGVGIYNRGNGIGVIKNIIVDTSYDINLTWNITTQPADYGVYVPGATPNDAWTDLFSS